MKRLQTFVIRPSHRDPFRVVIKPLDEIGGWTRDLTKEERDDYEYRRDLRRHEAKVRASS